MNKRIFIIYKAWCDPLENSADQAFGYDLVGFVETVEEADLICLGSKKVTKEEFGWAAKEGLPIYRYRSVNAFKNIQN